MASNGIMARRSFHRIWIAGKKTLVKRVPDFVMSQSTARELLRHTSGESDDALLDAASLRFARLGRTHESTEVAGFFIVSNDVPWLNYMWFVYWCRSNDACSWRHFSGKSSPMREILNKQAARQEFHWRTIKSDGGAYILLFSVDFYLFFCWLLLAWTKSNWPEIGRRDRKARIFKLDHLSRILFFFNVSPDLLFVFLKPICRHFLFKFANKRLMLSFVFQKLCDIVWSIGAFQNLA